jgi:cellulose synthase/poly-beta-1,6-N-acetylglucosamine synthase-like glycosyltransferase
MLRKPDIHTPTFRETLIIRLLIVTGVLSALHFIWFFFDPGYRGHPLLYAILCFVIGFGVVRSLTMWYYYASMSVPEVPRTDRDFTVDVLTTYFPGEPYAMIEETLRAIQGITYPHTTYLCDEADDPYLKEFCAELGVIHVTRDNRHHAKAGNINNALRQARGEICLILDPDHVPQPDFLDHIVPHFIDEEVGFVQTVQAYYNKFETLVARGAAQQTFHFYGPMMMTMQDYGTVNAIGANCTFRRAALDSIGGHAPGLAEDMHTAMLLYREGWKSVYVPRILARGQVPVTLTAYFKQQLKWSRGTFDLFLKVYPRIFNRLTWRQRLHYALMPVHYLAGLSYLGAFLIPILSLLLSEAPWRGNFVDFVLHALPFVFSSFVIRQYIQKWLLQHDERGFHIIGGILEIISWWIFTLGLLYTVINKRIPYLPTPKGGEEATHLNLLAPNLIVAGLSLTAIGFGLYRDFTPFSLVMAGFALVNALFMLFSVYLGTPVTNRPVYIRRRTPGPLRRLLGSVKRGVITGLDLMTLSVRKLAPALLLLVVFASLIVLANRQRSLAVVPLPPTSTVRSPTIPQLGYFYPSDGEGITDLAALDRLQDSLPYPIETVSSYFSWDTDRLPAFRDHLDDLAPRGLTAQITWEPWQSTPSARPAYRLIHIVDGLYDSTIVAYAQAIAEYEHTVLLRFAHEFNNPDYPWSQRSGNTPTDFRAAWRHVHALFQNAGADNVRWVWNPWRAGGAQAYFPGEAYVDFLGLTILNYGPEFAQLPEPSFSELYRPFADLQRSIDRPVIVSEFGSLGTPSEQREWAELAMDSIRQHHPEIDAVVYFYSAHDRRSPGGGPVEGNALNWTFPAPPDVHALPPAVAYPFPLTTDESRKALPPLRAVNYHKVSGDAPYDYLPTRSVLEADFAAIRQAGIRQIQISDPKVYTYNLLNVSADFGLEVIYNIWLPDTLDFLTDSLKTNALSDRILSRVASLKKYDHLVAWNFGNDLLYTLARHHPGRTVRRQQQAYLEWLARLVHRIRKVDDRPILFGVQHDRRAIQRIRAAGLGEWPIDGFCLRSKEITRDGASRGGRQLDFAATVFSGLSGDQLPSLPDSQRMASVILSNWQHQWASDQLTFDGLLDFYGLRTPAFRDLVSRWGNDTATYPELPAPAILPPAVTPFPGLVADYQALVREGQAWLPVGDSSSLQYLWALIRRDPYGIPVGRRELPAGPTVSFPLPEAHLEYLIELTVTDGTHSRTARRPLLPVR